MNTVKVPNTLRNQKLDTVVQEIVKNVQSSGSVIVQNQNDFTNAVVEAVEKAKKQLLNNGIRIFQANKLDQKEVYTQPDPEKPLEKPKIHHYQVKLTVRLSTSPTDIESDETLQINELDSR